MAYDLANRLVIGVASSALFDLAESDAVFREQGEQAYRVFQEANLDKPLGAGVALPFIKRLLTLNDLSTGPDEGPLVEVIVLSRNDPDTGLRVMRSVAEHSLPITRAIFMQGKSPYEFMPALNMSLFLSANESDVAEAIALGLPAGRVLPTAAIDDETNESLRIAFDFDGVLANDESEKVMQASGLEQFHEHESENLAAAHGPGPLREFLREVNKIQRREQSRRLADSTYAIRVHVSIVTARNAPSHERALNSLKDWGVTVNDAFFLGGIDKGAIIRVLRPHIFFDDQLGHLSSTSSAAPSVHVPFGTLNVPGDGHGPPDDAKDQT
jgi:5'-nucleotidase